MWYDLAGCVEKNTDILSENKQNANSSRFMEYYKQCIEDKDKDPRERTTAGLLLQYNYLTPDLNEKCYIVENRTRPPMMQQAQHNTSRLIGLVRNFYSAITRTNWHGETENSYLFTDIEQFHLLMQFLITECSILTLKENLHEKDTKNEEQHLVIEEHEKNFIAAYNTHLKEIRTRMDCIVFDGPDQLISGTLTKMELEKIASAIARFYLVFPYIPTELDKYHHAQIRKFIRLKSVDNDDEDEDEEEEEDDDEEQDAKRGSGDPPKTSDDERTIQIAQKSLKAQLTRHVGKARAHLSLRDLSDDCPELLRPVYDFVRITRNDNYPRDINPNRLHEFKSENLNKKLESLNKIFAFITGTRFWNKVLNTVAQHSVNRSTRDAITGFLKLSFSDRILTKIALTSN